MKLFFLLLLGLHAYAELEYEKNGVYTVPSPPELKAFADFNLEIGPRVRLEKNQIDFVLPTELTGELNIIRISKNEDGNWSGANAAGICEESTTEINCNLAFKNLKFDLDYAKSIATKKFPTEIDFDKRMHVINSFSREPIGKFSYYLKNTR